MKVTQALRIATSFFLMVIVPVPCDAVDGKDVADGSGPPADPARITAQSPDVETTAGADPCAWVPRPRRADQVDKIATEHPNGVAERVYFHYDKPDVAMRSYSSADVDGCTGTMIGPNVVLMAGHCKMRNRSATFRLYTGPMTQTTEAFPCTYLIHTFGDMDFNAYWCDENAAGESPGDKYGYADADIVVDPVTGELDYAASEALLTIAKPVYSVWMNSIDDIGGGNHSIYSEGTIYVTDAPTHWGSPNLNVAPDFRCGNACCDTGVQCTGNCDTDVCGTACTVGSCVRRATMSIAVGTDLWTNEGASGSGQFSLSTHRYLIGPQSTGPLDSTGRGGLAFVNHLYWGFTDPNLTCPTCCQSCLVDQINAALMQSLGVADPSQYYGYIDYINGVEDGLLDVQQVIEKVRGENTRDWYWLGFESLRRNAVWTRYIQGVTFDTSDPVSGAATIDTRGLGVGSHMLALGHLKLNLAGNSSYEVGLTTHVIQQGATPVLVVCLGKGFVQDCQEIDPPPFTSQRSVLRMWGPADAQLVLAVHGESLVHVADVSVVEFGDVMDFDSNDKRITWRNANTGGRGLIWPNGVDSATEPDWAGVVQREPNQPLDDDWSLSNSQLPIRGGDRYQVCFGYRTSFRDPLAAAWGVVRLVDGAGEIPGSRYFVDPTTSWGSACTSWFAVPADDNELQFGVYAFVSNSSGAYLVDEVDVRSESLFADGFELGPLGWRWSSSVGASP